MKIALVHELLTIRGGAERVLKIIAEMFPEAPIYTFLYDEKRLGDWFPKGRVRTSMLQPKTVGSFNHHLYLKKFPKAAEAWDFSEFDVVLSTSSAFAHGIITNGHPKHLSYIHSPARYLWDRTHDVVDQASHGILGPLKRWYLERTLHELRVWDIESSERPDVLLSASKVVQRRIELYWRRESELLYPPVDDFWFEHATRYSLPARDYFLIVSTLVPYKRIDLAIESCNALKKNLKIVGTGPDLARLKKLAGPTIEFLGYKEEKDLPELYANAIATIFPGDEDFGLVPLESMAIGTPVLAYRGGGALETMIEGETGEFFDEPTAKSLKKGVELIEGKKYSEEACRTQAKKFSRKHFEEKLRAVIESLTKDH